MLSCRYRQDRQNNNNNNKKIGEKKKSEWKETKEYYALTKAKKSENRH